MQYHPQAAESMLSAAGRPGLSIILVNWNALDYLQECIGSIYEYTRGISFEIIVVDNASTMGDIDELQAAYPGISIVKSAENLGFAKANNVGFRHSSGDYILLLNPDTRLVGPAVNTLLDAIASLPDAGIVGGRHVNPDLTVQTTSIQKFPTILNQILNVEFLRLRWPACPLWNIGPLFSGGRAPTCVEVIPGACMLMKRDVFEKAGMFTEDYFMYAEDIDLNWKIAHMGLSNYYVPEAVVIHYGGKSSSRQKASQWSTSMQYKAMGQYYVKNYSRLYSFLYRAAMASIAVLRLLLLVFAYAGAGIFWSRQTVRVAFAKWSAILKWALGLDWISSSVAK